MRGVRVPRRKREAFSLGPATRADRPALAPDGLSEEWERLGPVTVHVLHENPEWMPPFAAAFAAEGVDWDETLVTGGSLDLTAAPAEGLWWSRMSASAHTRGHTAAAEHARALLDVLEAHGRRVVNGRAVLDLELSKVRQLALLRAARGGQAQPGRQGPRGDPVRLGRRAGRRAAGAGRAGRRRAAGAGIRRAG